MQMYKSQQQQKQNTNILNKTIYTELNKKVLLYFNYNQLYDKLDN